VPLNQETANQAAFQRRSGERRHQQFLARLKVRGEHREDGRVGERAKRGVQEVPRYPTGCLKMKDLPPQAKKMFREGHGKGVKIRKRIKYLEKDGDKEDTKDP